LIFNCDRHFWLSREKRQLSWEDRQAEAVRIHHPLLHSALVCLQQRGSNMRQRRAVAALCCNAVCFCLLNSTVYGTTIQYQTVSGATVGGEPVNACATLTTSADTISVKLENFQADPNSPKSILYGLLFTVSTGQNSGTISSTTGVERTVHSGGTFTDVGPKSLIDWGLFTSGSQLSLDRLAAPGQKLHGIVGPPNPLSGLYAAAGGAVADSSTHDPFWAGSADFTLNVPGVTANSTITAATFSFNTTAGNVITATVVPEPAALTLALLGFGGVYLLLKRKPCRRVFGCQAKQ
jgi:hypothetical protein